MTLEQKFDNLETSLAQFEGPGYARFIRNSLRSDMFEVLANCERTKALDYRISLNSLDSALVIQEFLTAFGMHLKRNSSLAVDDKHYLFGVYPNW